MTNRRCFIDFMLCFLLAGLSGAFATNSLIAAERPNIVLIFADDLGWQETGFTGSDYCETPNLDRLAGQGMVFRNAYASASNCQPSRACMLSGQYTARHGVYAVGSTKRGPDALMRMIPIPNRGNLPLATVTMGESLKAAGYATGFFGKCHMKDSDKGKSEHAGFDAVKVSQHGLNSKDPADPKAIFSITEAACEFIEANRQGPFFAYLPHYAVHSALQGRAKTLAHFKEKPKGQLGHGDPLFGACLADLDTGVGMVLDKLKALGLDDNTLVVFTSDNGGTHVLQEPLRGKKGCYYEGGIRVPMIVRWPGKVARDSITHQVGHIIDFMPTLLELAESKYPREFNGHKILPVEGKSLLPVFRGQKRDGHESLNWELFGNRAIRQGDWKLVWGASEKTWELYDLKTDRSETNNLAGNFPERVTAMSRDWQAWQERIEN